LSKKNIELMTSNQILLRQVDKISRLGDVLATIFQRIKNLELLLQGDRFMNNLVPYVRNLKRKSGDREEESSSFKSKSIKLNSVVDADDSKST
ncbi:hypothetical protein, partial [Escherichia coli]|uniref:hypothetical protein n=1 Tax=Escherichia coli TaxID=562 RepID=UPI001AD8C2E6